MPKKKRQPQKKRSNPQSSLLHRDSIDRFFDNDFHLETRTIFISDQEDGDGVDTAMAEKVIKSLHLLSNHSHAPIRMILNSKGGNWYDGMACYDAIRACPCPVIIEVIGSCMSMATIILQAGDERLVYPNATFMVHDGSDSFLGEAKSFESWGEESKRLRNRMYEIYAKATKKPAIFWKKKCAVDFILTAEQAVELGLADRILNENQKK